jgi:DNA ligase-associated metallophosphoesterase
MEVILNSEKVQLLPEKGIFLPLSNTLVLADLHFGKINHFRKSGIPVPTRANDKNYEVLISLLNSLKPERVLFLGDLFHSHYNDEWEVLGQITKYFTSSSFELVLGNHDIMSELQYQRHEIKLHTTELKIRNFIFTHEPMDEVPVGYYNLSGHLHPGVNLRGSGRQSITLPCFYFGKHKGILPAFGSFTGLAHINPKKEERIFVIADEKIVAYSNA